MVSTGVFNPSTLVNGIHRAPDVISIALPVSGCPVTVSVGSSVICGIVLIDAKFWLMMCPGVTPGIIAFVGVLVVGVIPGPPTTCGELFPTADVLEVLSCCEPGWLHMDDGLEPPEALSASGTSPPGSGGSPGSQVLLACWHSRVSWSTECFVTLFRIVFFVI